MPCPPCLDAEYCDELLATLGAAALAETLETYRATTQAALARLRAELAAGEAQAARRTAHYIGSGSATLGALTATALARQLEHLPLEAPTAAATELADRLAEAVQECSTALARQLTQ
jgi:HPt (histidine-containing phosphotransfer) domain-containing protein